MTKGMSEKAQARKVVCHSRRSRLGDGGRIELKKRDGSVVRAWPDVEAYFTGTDEILLPSVTLSDLSQPSFLDFEEWPPTK